jgi:hypothetical protein
MFAILSVVCYTAFSFHYERQVREDSASPLVSATLLYGLAAGILIVLVGGSSLLYGWHFSIPQITHLWGSLQQGEGVNKMLFWTIFMMAMGYSLHIASEAICREKIDQSAYSIVFQLNAVAIIVFNQVLYAVYVPLWGWIGGGLVLSASIFTLYLSAKGESVMPIKRRYLAWAVLSALSCGGALFVDGEMGAKVIIGEEMQKTEIPVFLFYEFLTFFLPFLFVRGILFFDSNIEKGQLTKSLKRYFKGYFLSALFSVGQFVFSVYALSFKEQRFMVAIILATTPVWNVFFDRNAKKEHQRKIEIALAFVTSIGVALAVVHH